LGLEAAATDAVSAPLEALEREFRPLAADLPMEIEPAFEFRAGDPE
jgi:hypothetical protein